MKKLVLVAISVFAFAMPKNHMMTNDEGLKLAFAGKYKEALNNFVNRCEKNDGWACGEAGYFYEKGWGANKNHNLAINYYKKGCKSNDSDSCTMLGYEAHKKGNNKEAKKLLQKGCKLGNKNACKYANQI